MWGRLVARASEVVKVRDVWGWENDSRAAPWAQ